MTEDQLRIDLGAIADLGGPEDEDRVVGMALRHISETELFPPGSLLANVARFARPSLVAAAAVIVIASAALVVRRARPGNMVSASPLSAVAEWASANRVPTNAELMTVFEGYGQ